MPGLPGLLSLSKSITKRAVFIDCEAARATTIGRAFHASRRIMRNNSLRDGKRQDAAQQPSRAGRGASAAVDHGFAAWLRRPLDYGGLSRRHVAYEPIDVGRGDVSDQLAAEKRNDMPGNTSFVRVQG